MGDRDTCSAVRPDTRSGSIPRNAALRLVWLKRLALVASMTCGVACAADAGDPDKGDGGGATADHVGTPPVDGGGSDDTFVGTMDTGSPTQDSTTPEDTSPVEDTSPPPEDTSPPEDSAPETATGTGCAAGAMVITMTKTGNSGSFGTTDAVCIEFMGSVNGWNASNVQGRTVTVTGSATTMPTITAGTLGNQPAESPGADGFIYWNYTGSATAVTFASMSTF
jgi:hypothetical protein